MKKIIILCLFIQCSLTYIFGQIPEYEIGITYHDVQTTRSMQDRIYKFEDGTIGAVFNMSLNYPVPNDFSVGYNYFDGQYWGPQPLQSITSGDAENPSYTQYGENGEIVVSEGENGLYLNYRINRGTGPWQEVIFPGPAGCTKLYSPQIVTSGANDQVIHIFALCKDSMELQYQDNIGQLLYSRSSDGGTTWTPLHHEFDFNEDYFGFSELSLAVAERDGTIAFVIGDYFTDLIMMKSVDAGDTWQKTILVDHPYPWMQFGVMQTDTFWTHTGSMDIALDSDKKSHVVFSLCHISSEISTIWYYDTLSDGIAYWNEDMVTFSNNINALNPYGHPDSELIEDYNLVVWVQDINGDGEINFLPFNSENPPWYPVLGLSTMPTLSISDNNQLLLVWSSLTETYDNGSENYRHLWARVGFIEPNPIFWSNFAMLTDDLIHIFDECVYPVISPDNNNGYMNLIYQIDNQPGLSINGTYPTENKINYMSVYLGYLPTPWAIAEFSADTTEIIEGDTVQYINNSSGYPFEDLTWLWEFEGGTPSQSTDINPQVIYFTSGIYDVKLKVYNNGIFYDELLKEEYIHVSNDIGIDESTFIEEIFPNPSTGKFYVSTPGNSALTIEVTDMLGAKLLSKNIDQFEKNTLVDLTNQPDGIYFLVITNGNKTSVKKLIVNH